MTMVNIARKAVPTSESIDFMCKISERSKCSPLSCLCYTPGDKYTGVSGYPLTEQLPWAHNLIL